MYYTKTTPPVCVLTREDYFRPGEHVHIQLSNEFPDYIGILHKHEFIEDELDLTNEQEDKFFPIYDAMEDELHKVQRETQKLEKQVADKKATDVEYDAASKAIIELKKKEADIELKYFDKFKTVLSSKQIFQLKRAEKKFTRKIMNAHNKKRKKD